jgi:hypothetical protein
VEPRGRPEGDDPSGARGPAAAGRRVGKSRLNMSPGSPQGSTPALADIGQTRTFGSSSCNCRGRNY